MRLAVLECPQQMVDATSHALEITIRSVEGLEA
jgi:hypothetical protein